MNRTQLNRRRRVRKVPIIGARQFARELEKKNKDLTRQLAHLHAVVKDFAIEDALTRTIALEDLAAEQAVQERRLRDLIEQARRTYPAGANGNCRSVANV